ncbi:hypothetical protein PH213_35885 [Streptomyces sp. SRF1]|uniref:hypothetical protein n=1 Tax=Streptomyces sp. SRF1 TaxID=1549642 RepID=UPI0025B02A76|nr:hypothetical protein [Streptomyces sp. SRF1]MDN3059812.1 hypothetical protein [Streptomyces sp. SRF1]
MYQHDNYKGGWAYVTHTDKDLRNNYWDRGGKVDNGTSSVKNQTRKYVDLYQNVANAQGQCTGAHTTSYPGTNDKNLSNDAIKRPYPRAGAAPSARAHRTGDRRGHDHPFQRHPLGRGPTAAVRHRGRDGRVRRHGTGSAPAAQEGGCSSHRRRRPEPHAAVRRL